VTYFKPQSVSAATMANLKTFDQLGAAIGSSGGGEWVKDGLSITWLEDSPDNLLLKLGFQQGDEVLSVDGYLVAQGSARAIFEQAKKWNQLAVKVRRNRQEMVLSFCSEAK
jgi:hypothetical protein